MELCHFCGTRPHDDASRITDQKTKTQRIRRCAECKKHLEIIDKVIERALLKSMLIAATVLLVALLLAYLIWGWGEYMALIAMGVGLLWIVGLFVTMKKVEMHAKQQVPYKIKFQFEVEKELDDSLTIGDLMKVVAPEVAYSTVAVARWQSSTIETLVGKAVLGPILAPADYRAGLIGISDQQLFVFDFGKIAIKEAAMTLARLDRVVGKPLHTTVDLSQLTVTEAVNGNDLVLSLGAPLNLKARFSAADESAERARVIANAIKNAQK